MLICGDSITELEMMSINFGGLARKVSTVSANQNQLPVCFL